MSNTTNNSGAQNLKSGLIDFIAGSLAGASHIYVAQPFDTVKVKQQTFPHLYQNMTDCLRKTYQQDGIYRGLYAGSIPAVVASVAENSVLFAAYGGCQKFISLLSNVDNTAELSTVGNALAGASASFFSSFTLCPTELVKCKLQADREVRRSSPAARSLPPLTISALIKDIYKIDGVPGFFRGLTSTLTREMPGYFFFFGSYEGVRELLRKPNQSKDDIGVVKTMVAGAASGIALWTSIFPVDVIKSRIQVQNLNSGMLTVGMQIMKREGLSALYNGLSITIIRTVPASAALFLIYEYTKKALS